MAIVVDTSIIIAVILNESSKPQLIQHTSNAELIAPASLHWEIGNALSAMIKRKRLTLTEAHLALREYQKIALRFYDVALDSTMDVVAQYALYAYDAYFITCARLQSAPLLTLDHKLQTAAQAAGVTIIEVGS
ncbi:twitching motility protein PilT [Kouleothrix aurantiaca]|uniref:Twitching motility protein PilT n=1 Tax=Kouleothrix aurantiaca TaxID=186479 RepID=A0A0P9F1H6_9CHLR|nr:twitching motility protein PilT [Kouleothrix aurantiaca]